jgi:hypothetical protein
MKTLVVLAAVALFIGCSKNEPTPVTAKPSEIVVKFWDAVSRQDTAAYMRLAAQGRREMMRQHPERWPQATDYWKKNKVSVEIVSESQDSSIAVVTYRLKVTGSEPLDTTRTTQLYLENGSWKYGW